MVQDREKEFDKYLLNRVELIFLFKVWKIKQRTHLGRVRMSFPSPLNSPVKQGLQP